MPRFFFHIILTDGMRIEDDEGRDLANLEGARDAALALARNIVFDLTNAAEPVEKRAQTLDKKDRAKVFIHRPFLSAASLVVPAGGRRAAGWHRM